MWAAIGVTEKERLEKKAAELLEVWVKEKEVYVKEREVYLKEKAAPTAPKRPMTAYFLFMGEQRAEVKKNNPDFKVGDIVRVGS